MTARVRYTLIALWIVVFASALIVPWWSPAYWGRIGARRDIANGRLSIIGWRGKPDGEIKLFARLLQERLGIEMGYRGCPLGEDTPYDDAYDEVMRQEIKRRFGPDVVEKVREEAHERWRNGER